VAVVAQVDAEAARDSVETAVGRHSDSWSTAPAIARLCLHYPTTSFERVTVAMAETVETVEMGDSEAKAATVVTPKTQRGAQTMAARVVTAEMVETVVVVVADQAVGVSLPSRLASLHQPIGSLKTTCIATSQEKAARVVTGEPMATTVRLEASVLPGIKTGNDYSRCCLK